MIKQTFYGLIYNNHYRNRVIFSLITGYLTFKNKGYIDEYVKSTFNFLVYFNKRKYFGNIIFNMAMKLSYFKNKLEKEIYHVEQGIEKETKSLEDGVKFRVNKLPTENLVQKQILQKMKENFDGDLKHHNPLKLSGTLYNTPNQDETKLLKGVMDIYYKTNPLHADIYPSLITMEKDIVKMTKHLLNCPEEKGFGTLTTGGTESIILALYGYREYARKYKGITRPEVVVLKTVHPAFDKGCYYLGIKLKKVDVDKNNNINKTQLEWYVNHNTIVVVGSVPSFPHGLIDDISLLNSVVKPYNIPIHIDACLGGFIFPFIDGLGAFDFRIPGVQSVSLDTHKYGCCPKGSSVLLFRDKEFFESCYFIQSEWCGGIYATTNITGSRSGLNLAWTWALLTYQGENTLKTQAIKISKNVLKIRQAFQNDYDIFIFGEPQLCVVGFGSHTVNIYSVSGKMKEKGWNLNELQNPSSFHFCLTNCHTDEIIDEFITDLKSSLDQVVNEKTGNNHNNTKETSSIYGTTQRVPDQSIVDFVVKVYLNTIH
jgi:sphinganine-1-phosphate aldolase